ncbi:winged helix-turn-helix transcriptional regulator [Nonomuraea roseoviolacea]|uniref:DNA-binding HxlR family transcriptional regulator/peroxiredoxin n=1 Tax=Nonomuraea roseoviolacea subsp. carminata TaxID=160689 RepID=A0ABT1JUN0_9ACTN|nr:winged helix-turn-helix transcriptional regulator [Nonomuraea roseoviolacea]MCP2345446.1 DNA-binding HxlR family transcriptional regulator/peroxiredoxin [Nonomuraea roseoviolacea subsp. carminata]
MVRELRTQDTHCSIAQAAAVVGDWWSLLIVREVARGHRRFDELLGELGISRKVLTERLRHLVDHGVLTREPYQTGPVRHEYVLTDAGWALTPVLITMQDWADRWLQGDGSLTGSADPEGVEASRVHALLSTRLPWPLTLPVTLAAGGGTPTHTSPGAALTAEESPRGATVTQKSLSGVATAQESLPGAVAAQESLPGAVAAQESLPGAVAAQEALPGVAATREAPRGISTAQEPPYATTAAQQAILGEAGRLDVVADAPATVIFVYPATGMPAPLPPGWGQVPGAAGCTLENRLFRDRMPEFAAHGVAVHGVSTQRPDEQAAFATAEGIPFPLFSDMDLRFAAALRLPTFRAGHALRLKRAILVVDRHRVVRHTIFPVLDIPKAVEESLVIATSIAADR